MAAVTAEASRFSIQTTTTWEIADEPVPTGVEDGRADGAAVSLAVGAGVADGPAAGVDDGRADAVGRGALVARTLGALADGGAPAEPADVADARADGVPTAAGLPADAPENEAPVVVDAARLAGGGVAWHAARRAASPRIAAARVSRRRSDRPSAIARSR